MYIYMLCYIYEIVIIKNNIYIDVTKRPSRLEIADKIEMTMDIEIWVGLIEYNVIKLPCYCNAKLRVLKLAVKFIHTDRTRRRIVPFLV